MPWAALDRRSIIRRVAGAYGNMRQPTLVRRVLGAVLDDRNRSITPHVSASFAGLCRLEVAARAMLLYNSAIICIKT